MPVLKEYHVFHNGVWVGILGDDVGPPPPPPPPPPPGVGPPPAYVAAGGAKNATAGIVLNWPNPHAAGQIGLAVCETAAQALGLLPAGWAHAPGSPQVAGTPGAAGSVGLAVLWKRAVSAAEIAADIGDSGDHQIGRILLFDDVYDAGDPFDLTGNAANATATVSTGVTIPAATTTSDNCRIVTIVANATDTTTAQAVSGTASNGTLTDFVGLTSHQHTAGWGGGFTVHSGVKATAGVYGVTTMSLATASAQARISLALRPTVGAPPPPPGAFRTMIGSQGLITSLWGTQPTPDLFQVNQNGTEIAEAGGWLDQAATKGSCMICRVSGGNANSKNPDGSFSPALWKGMFDQWKAEVTAVSGGVAKLRAAVADGRWRALYTLDDFIFGVPQGPPPPNSYLHGVTFEEFEDICKWVKVDSPSPWPWMPLVARGVNKYLRSIAAATGPGDRINGVRQYHYLDAGWGQARPETDPDPVVYYNREVNDGLACGLGLVGGINMLDRGRGDTPGWGCQPGGLADKCSMSPAEIRRWGAAALAHPNIHGFNVYSYNFGVTYWSLPEIQAAMQDVYADSVGRNDGPVNVRGDLTPA